MLDGSDLTQENELIERLMTILEENEGKGGLIGNIVGDWKDSLQDNKDVNTLILSSDPAQLQLDLDYETELLGSFLTALGASQTPNSQLAQRLRDRWYELFTRERERNKQIV